MIVNVHDFYSFRTSCVLAQHKYRLVLFVTCTKINIRWHCQSTC